MSSQTSRALFSAYGVELEYMIVNRSTLNVAPLCDRLIHSVAGSYESEIERGEISWSNELVNHVIELKTNGPAPGLAGLAGLFQSQIEDLDRRLEEFGARLMPTAMHPWMNPDQETQLWPHEFNPVYESYDRIFGCGGHGWSNLQSVHLNLPFSSDEEFGRLHAAIRILMPLLPALAASSPLVDGRRANWLDARMAYYRTNSERVPSVTGRVIPEAVFTHREYKERIFDPMYRDIAPLDPQGILRHEWLNSRGAIARFDRGSIEIRVLDIQECPSADLGVLMLIDAALKALVKERWTPFAEQKNVKTEPLETIFLQCIEKAECAPVADRDYLRLLGIESEDPVLAGGVWKHLFAELGHEFKQRDAKACAALEWILEHGSLSTRILNRLTEGLDVDSLHFIYAELCECLAQGRLFR